MIRDAQWTLQAVQVYRTAGDAQSHFSQLGSNIPSSKHSRRDNADTSGAQKLHHSKLAGRLNARCVISHQYAGGIRLAAGSKAAQPLGMAPDDLEC